MRTLVKGCAWRFLAEYKFGAIAVRDLVCWIGETEAELCFLLGFLIRRDRDQLTCPSCRGGLMFGT
jgi:hypothetical protein